MIRRFLDCSSGHLSTETWSWLDTNLAKVGVEGSNSFASSKFYHEIKGYAKAAARRPFSL